MAAYNPDHAFLGGVSTDLSGAFSNNNDLQEQPVASDDDEDYDPSNLMPSTDYPVQPSKSEADSASSPPSGSRPASPPSVAEAASSKQASAEPAAPQQRIVGGFVVESSDDEEMLPSAKPKAVGPALQNVTRGASNTPQRSLSQTPNNTLPNSNVHIHSASQDQGGSAVISTGVADTVPSTASVVPVAAASAHDTLKSPPVASTPAPTAVPVPQVAASSLPQARLPHDRIGILEDRITEDPRGDMDAWMSLISEHRKRNKFDEVRAVYERFFKVFPSAVSHFL
jgi:cleavage stimulation factor subunit 3